MFKSKQSLLFGLLVLALGFFITACEKDQSLSTPNSSSPLSVEQRMPAALNSTLNKVDSTDTDSLDCFGFVFPIQIELEDGTVLTANNYDELFAIEDDIDASDLGADFIYPFEVVLADGSNQTITDFEDFEDLLIACYGEEWEDDEDDDGEDEDDDEDDEDDGDDDDHGDCPGDLDEFTECFEIVFPVTLIIGNNETVVVNNEDELFAILEGLEDEELDELDIEFPIDVFIYADSTTVTLNNFAELDEILEDCFGEFDDEDVYGCFELNFPFQVTVNGETTTINDEMAFEDLLESDVDWDFAYPLSVTLEEDGSIVTLESEADFETLIDNCLD